MSIRDDLDAIDALASDPSFQHPPPCPHAAPGSPLCESCARLWESAPADYLDWLETLAEAAQGPTPAEAWDGIPF